jgi:sugar phosphate isomerase/epimerase
MKLGITQFAASADGTHFVEAAARLKLAGVEPYIGSLDSEFLTYDKDQRGALKQLAATNHVEIPSVCVGLFNGDAALITASESEKAARVTSECLRFSSDIGARIMLLCTYILSHPDTPEKEQNLLRVVRAVEPLARKLGVKIALETPLPTERLAQVVDAAASDHVGVYYDFGNAVAGRFDPAKELEILGKRIFAIHVKDSILGKLGGLHMGAGDVDFDAAMHATAKIGYDGWMLLETPGGDEAALRQDIAALRRLAPALRGDHTG